MTERLYYRDPMLVEFNAVIVEVTERADTFTTVLDQSAFYPTSGGQPHDTGTINGIEIVDVTEGPNDQVCHISRQPVGGKGDRAHGIVDRDRRRMHCRLHTAQHVLSQAFMHLYEHETVSVHLGREYGAIELDTPTISDDRMQAAEQLAHDVIEANQPIHIMLVNGSEARRLPLRKPPQRQGMIRVIRIGDFDWSACGGTHCGSTSEVGLLKILGVEKMRGRALVKFLAGRQAWSDYRERFAATSQLTRKFTCHVNDLSDRIDKLAAENSQLRKQLTGLQKELLPAWVDRFAAEAEDCAGCPLVVTAVQAYDERIAGQLATRIADSVGGVALLYVSGRLMLAAGAESDIDAGRLARRFCEMTGLKGGGGRTLAQVGGASRDRLPSYRDVMVRLLCHA